MLGFFTCGFQLGFVTVHLPSYLIDRGLSAEVGGWTLGVIGLFNIVGAMTSGWLGGRMPKRYILSFIYFARALAVVGLITLPASPVVTLIYGAVTGLLWLSSVPPTSGLVAVMFGTRWLAMLFGIAFFSHQVGGFLGVYLGGLLYERTGSYDVVWWLGVLFGVISAVINLPIVEKPVARLALSPAGGGGGGGGGGEGVARVFVAPPSSLPDAKSGIARLAQFDAEPGKPGSVGGGTQCGAATLIQ